MTRIFIIFAITICSAFADTTFLAHYNGNTGNYGFDADYATGSPTASTNSVYWPKLTSSKFKFGYAALELPWWSGTSLIYSANENYNNESATIEFYVDTSGMFDSISHEFDGVRRYVFNDNLGWGTSGHVDIWFDGTAGSKTARLVVHIQGDRNDEPVNITMMGTQNLSYTDKFVHYAIQWNCDTGRSAVYYQGFLASRLDEMPWEMSNTPNNIEIGMRSSQSPPLLLDDLRISGSPIYDSFSGISERVFNLSNAETLVCVSGDTDFDGIVNFEDFVVLSSNWQEYVLGGKQQADFDMNGYVNIDDMIILCQHWLDSNVLQ